MLTVTGEKKVLRAVHDLQSGGGGGGGGEGKGATGRDGGKCTFWVVRVTL